MLAALRGSYVEFVVYNGVTERYPSWFSEELYDCTYTDESRYTFYAPPHQRDVDYYEKQLVEDYSVFIRKPNNMVHLTDWETFHSLYQEFRFDKFTNSGIAALQDDCIEYVECYGGIIAREFPEWFYEYYTEAVNLPQSGETIFLRDAHDHDTSTWDKRGPYLSVSETGEVSVDERSVFLRNRFGEIRPMLYTEFIKYYDDDPEINQLGEFEHGGRYRSIKR